MKIICKDCGWEIVNVQWWNNIDKDKWLCDDCEMTEQIKSNKRQGIRI
jgi:hypothetical protein